MSTRVLFSWIGFRDLNFIADKLKDEKFAAALKKAKDSRQKAGSNISETSNYSPVYEIIKDKILGEIKSAKPQIDKDRMNRLILFCDLTDDVLIEGAKSYFENNVSFNGKHQDKKLFQRVEIIKISPRNTHDYEAVLTAVTEQWNIQERPQNIIPYFNNCCPVKISGVG
ncbi:MAG: hypothetical protein E7057_04855 [Lentisphaerae bacterium]|nr:hypothetical protein [Lentisphaerota bacterium]